jgi:hypothetical protein
MMEAVRNSETSDDNHFTRQYIPEDYSERSLACLQEIATGPYAKVQPFTY